MIKKLTPALMSIKNLFFKQAEIIDYLNNNPIPTGGSEFTYEIGQYVPSEGGVIAHRWLSTSEGGSPTAGTVQNYLVVDTDELSSGAQYASSNTDISDVESVWDGSTNTTNLIAAGAGAGITAGTAAELCSSSVNGGKSDWYLPAINELRKMNTNKWEIEQGLLNSGGTILGIRNRWSSTESGATTAQLFLGTGISDVSTSKAGSAYVRAIRRFSI